MNETDGKQLCAECEKPLTQEEIDIPDDHGNGPICQECEFENYWWRCHFCECYERDEYEIQAFAVFDAEEAGVSSGIYRVLSKPFYTQCMIGGGWIHESAVERIADLPEDQDDDGVPCEYLCSNCAAKYIDTKGTNG